MYPVDYIISAVMKLSKKYRTRDPYELCDALDVNIKLKDLGDKIKAFYFHQSRVSNIILNRRVPEPMRGILAAHELGHDQLHRHIAKLKGFHETELFCKTNPTEYEANIFAAELMISDKELLELLNDEKSFIDVASELYVPPALLDFKIRVLEHKGYSVKPLYIANGDFLSNEIDCFHEEEY